MLNYNHQRTWRTYNRSIHNKYNEIHYQDNHTKNNYSNNKRNKNEHFLL